MVLVTVLVGAGLRFIAQGTYRRDYVRPYDVAVSSVGLTRVAFYKRLQSETDTRKESPDPISATPKLWVYRWGYFSGDIECRVYFGTGTRIERVDVGPDPSRLKKGQKMDFIYDHAKDFVPSLAFTTLPGKQYQVPASDLIRCYVDKKHPSRLAWVSVAMPNGSSLYLNIQAYGDNLFREQKSSDVKTGMYQSSVTWAISSNYLTDPLVRVVATKEKPIFLQGLVPLPMTVDMD